MTESESMYLIGVMMLTPFKRLLGHLLRRTKAVEYSMVYHRGFLVSANPT